MAVLIPTPPTSPGPASERQVRTAATALDESWTVLHSVAWLSRIGRQHDGEADFLFLHPELGLLVAEVKGGMEVGVSRGSWHSVDHQGRSHKIKDPFEQALISKHSLVRYLRDRLKDAGSIPAAHAVVFPGLFEVPDFGPHAPTAIAIVRKDLREDLRGSLTRAFNACGQAPLARPLSRQLIESVVDLLAPVVVAKQLLVDTLDEARDHLVQLTERQAGILDVLKHQRRALVTGVAGTGKTVLAREKVLQLEAEGFRPVFLVHSIALRDHLAIQLPNHLAPRTVHTFLSALLRRAGAVPADSTPSWNMVNNVLSRPSAEVVEKIRSLGGMIDSLVADEVQYFPPAWWTLVEPALKSSAAPVYCFGDYYQELFRSPLLKLSTSAAENGLSRLPFADNRYELSICR